MSVVAAAVMENMEPEAAKAETTTKADSLWVHRGVFFTISNEKH